MSKEEEEKTDLQCQVIDIEEEERVFAEEREGLRRIPGRIPLAVWLISLSTLLERFAYFAFLGPLR